MSEEIQVQQIEANIAGLERRIEAIKFESLGRYGNCFYKEE